MGGCKVMLVNLAAPVFFPAFLDCLSPECLVLEVDCLGGLAGESIRGGKAATLAAELERDLRAGRAVPRGRGLTWAMAVNAGGGNKEG